MARHAIVELEDGRILKGEVQSAINFGSVATGDRYEIEMKINGRDSIIWKQAVDGGRLLRLDD